MRSLKKIIAGIMAASLMLTCVSVQADGLKDGTYTQSEQGFQGDVTVPLTIENGKITDAVVEGPNETEGVGLAALPVLQEQILEKQALNWMPSLALRLPATPLLLQPKKH